MKYDKLGGRKVRHGVDEKVMFGLSSILRLKHCQLLTFECKPKGTTTIGQPTIPLCAITDWVFCLNHKKNKN